MQLCANDNIQVCQPSNAGQMFHLLRRQMLRPYRKPLIVMTPKSLLRAKQASVPLSGLTSGGFAALIGETQVLSNVRRVVLCSGKVYYDLLAAREQRDVGDIALVRIEQLYPFPRNELSALLADYATVTEVLWVQEEPQNQGAWFAIQHHILACLQAGQSLRYVGRDFSASPAVGYPDVYEAQKQAIIEEVFVA
jgi:2-oxoglutarate dehydrogenase E1 component